MGNINLFSVALEMAVELDSLYRDAALEREDLVEFMEANEWFGITHTMKDGALIIANRGFTTFKERLTLWLYAYKKSGREKINLMLKHFNGIYPITCRLFREFVVKRGAMDDPSAWKLLDYLLSEIDREITMYSEADLEMLVKPMDTGTTLATAYMFADFLQTTRYDDKPLTRWAYAFDSRATLKNINHAYPMQNFAVMAYCIFSEEMRKKQCLIEKAVQSRKYADLWLFASLHFICALRVSDMRRLPAPSLPYSKEIVLEKILAKTFSEQEASALVEELCIRLKLKPMKPSKTVAHKDVPEIKFSVPESFKVPLGIIMAIALAHHPEIKPGDSFVFPAYSNRNSVKSFFGEHFITALGNRNFTSLRCNRSYLQGIDIAVGPDNAPGKPKGYMLASLARSHKGGVGSLAEATDVYLRDARFSGYNPEFIIREMFERGVFSFIPAVLLEAYAGDKYKILPVKLQTILIGEVGLAPHQIEWMAYASDRALEKAKKVVGSVLKDPDKIHENVFVALQNIASGNAPSRQEEYLCLMTAAGLPCSFADRDGCIGCGYEIYTKAAMYTLMKEYAHLARLKKSSKPEQAWRYDSILKQAIMPAISEMIASAKVLYNKSDMDEFLDIVERGLEHADCNA